MTVALPTRIAAAIREQLTGGRQWPSPLDLACDLDPRIRRTPALELVNAALVEAFNTPDARLAISIAPQEGKTTLAVVNFIVWALQQEPDLPIVLGTYNQSLANRGGRLIRNTIEANPQLGIRIADDNGAKHEWSIAGKHGGLVSAGRGVGISGRPASLIVIDDPFKEGEAQSETIREQAWDWWTEGLSARLAPGAAVIVIHTRWHTDDLIGRLLERDAHADWKYINIPAQCEDPATDPLGRTRVGEFMVSARGRSQRQWEQRKLTVGSRVWNALYQGRPAPAEGGMVKRDWWKHYDQPLWIELDNGQRRTLGMDAVLISADLTFKGEDHSDYVAIGVWARRGPNAYLLDQVRGHYDFPETIRRLEALCARWPDAALKIIEDKANGPAVIATLRHRIPGIVAEIPQGSKVARLAAVSPLIEAGNVHLPNPQLAPWVGDYVEEFAGFPNAAHDDQVDHTTQGLNRLLLQPLLTADDDEWTQLAPEHSIINY
nr:MAG: terminase large subunit [Caudoviricetes sp.]